MVAAAPPAAALNVNAVYRTACTRDLGVILKVEKRTIYLLGLDGVIRPIPRHEIVSLAYYPVSQLPLVALPATPKVPVIHVETLYQGRVSSLATGWPIDYSETKVAFLLQNGKDIVIEKESIWSLGFDDSPAPALPPGRPAEIEFVHPQSAGFCASPSTVEGQPTPARRVFAQQILNDPIVIKRELDRLQEGYDEVLEFLGDEKFYPVPFLYTNRTELGLWVSLLSRYGASKSRSNNYTPTVVDELALGPFRYQHYFLTGAAPNPLLLHDEAQSQIYYRFKAAYFHASVFLDPNLVLVGEKYAWREEDLEDETLDDRMNEVLAIEFGFDFGPLAIEIAPAVLAQSAVKTSRFFDAKGDHNLWRAGLRFTQRLWQAELLAGRARSTDFLDNVMMSGDTTWLYTYGRANVGLRPIDRLALDLSAIWRTLDYELEQVTASTFSYDSTSLSLAAIGRWALSHRLAVGGSLMAEIQSRQGPDETEAKRRVMPKVAAFTSFSF